MPGELVITSPIAAPIEGMSVSLNDLIKKGKPDKINNDSKTKDKDILKKIPAAQKDAKQLHQKAT